jgi:hypothetical protein
MSTIREKYLRLRAEGKVPAFPPPKPKPVMVWEKVRHPGNLKDGDLIRGKVYDATFQCTVALSESGEIMSYTNEADLVVVQGTSENSHWGHPNVIVQYPGTTRAEWGEGITDVCVQRPMPEVA